MNLERYTLLSKEDSENYEFYSDGPKGKIKKLVSFSKIEDNPVVYNLGFGDEDPMTGKMNDQIVSDNKDRELVLATVAYAALDFCIHHDNPYIYFEGSSRARTRLYQMGISGIFEIIRTDFEVFGLKDNNWKSFQGKVNYEAFLIRKK